MDPSLNVSSETAMTPRNTFRTTYFNRRLEILSPEPTAEAVQLNILDDQDLEKVRNISYKLLLELFRNMFSTAFRQSSSESLPHNLLQELFRNTFSSSAFRRRRSESLPNNLLKKCSEILSSQLTVITLKYLHVQYCTTCSILIYHSIPRNGFQRKRRFSTKFYFISFKSSWTLSLNYPI
jgi:hypothetical protein